MGMPGKAELMRALKRLEKVEGSLALADDASPLERFRYDICQQFIKYKIRNKVSQREISQILEIDEAKISKILHHNIEEFSTDRLISLYSKLVPDVKLKVG